MAQTRQDGQQAKTSKRCCCLSFNSLPSVWYGIATTIFHVMSHYTTFYSSVFDNYNVYR